MLFTQKSMSEKLILTQIGCIGRFGIIGLFLVIFLIFSAPTANAQRANSLMELYLMDQQERKLEKALSQEPNGDPRRGVLVDERELPGYSQNNYQNRSQGQNLQPRNIQGFNGQQNQNQNHNGRSMRGGFPGIGNGNEEIIAGDKHTQEMFPFERLPQNVQTGPNGVISQNNPNYDPDNSQNGAGFGDYANEFDDSRGNDNQNSEILQAGGRSGNFENMQLGRIPSEFESGGFQDYRQIRYDNMVGPDPNLSGEMLNLRNGPGFFAYGQEASKGDARLNCVYFINPQVGWAVGEHGTIWHTRNSGRSWVLQKCPVDLPLHGVDFIDEQNGIIVGGSHQPYTHIGNGVVLVTRNGGASWEQIETPNLPVMKQVRITDIGAGWGIGLGSNRCPSGLFTFSENGAKWTPVEGAKVQGLVNADFYGNYGCGITSDGKIQPLGTLMHEETDKPDIGMRRAKAVSFYSIPAPATGVGGWIVGDGGMLLHTKSAGLEWKIVRQSILPRASELFDLKTVFAHGNKVWVAGSPGSIIFRSEDSGKTWQGVPTGTTAAIRHIVFTSPKYGFAVGDYGTILATEDGGKTWILQREGGRRLSFLCLATRAEDVPFEAIAKLGGEEGYFGGVQLLMRDDREGWGKTTISCEDRVHEAVVKCGGVGAWESWPFPVDPNYLRVPLQKLVERINRENDGKGLLMFRESLIRSIRQHRPNVILLADPGVREANPARDFLLRETLVAVRDAADATIFPEHLHESRLPNWQVQKVVLAIEDGVRGEFNIRTQTLLPKLGNSVDSLASEARGIVSKTRTVPHKSVGFQTEYDLMPPRGDRDFFTGMTIQPGSDARRNSVEPRPGSFETLNKYHSVKQNLISIFENSLNHSNPGNRGRLALTATEMIRNMPPEMAIDTLLRLSAHSRAIGENAVAADLEKLVLETYPSEPGTLEVYANLIRNAIKNDWMEKERNLNNTSVAKEVNATETRLEEAIRAGKNLKRAAEELYMDPEIRFLLATAERELSPAKSRESYAEIANAKYAGPWKIRSETELWIGRSVEGEENETPCPMPYIRVPYTGTRPVLDGSCDEAVWLEHRTPTLLSSLKMNSLENSSGGSAAFDTRVMFMHDEEFLYIAVRGRKVPGFEYRSDFSGPRARDADLDSEDRVEIFLDLNRDYSSFYRLVFDHRGWCAESYGDDKRWNPTVFISNSSDEEFWTLEIAVEKDTIDPVLYEEHPDVLGVAVRRLVPGVGIECWNEQNAFGMEEGFGLLLFE